MDHSAYPSPLNTGSPDLVQSLANMAEKATDVMGDKLGDMAKTSGYAKANYEFQLLIGTQMSRREYNLGYSEQKKREFREMGYGDITVANNLLAKTSPAEIAGKASTLVQTIEANMSASGVEMGHTRLQQLSDSIEKKYGMAFPL